MIGIGLNNVPLIIFVIVLGVAGATSLITGYIAFLSRKKATLLNKHGSTNGREDKMITEIGTLVGIVKNLLDINKTGRELLHAPQDNNLGITQSIRNTQERLAGISDQMFQSMTLSKMLPIWLKEYSAFDLYTDTLTDDEVRLLDRELRGLIADSIHDHFSGTFFRTSFAVLPGAEEGIQRFRDRLTALETQLNGIPAGDATSWRRAWPILKVRMQDLRIEAVKLSNLADEVLSSLIKELRDAAHTP